MSTDCDDAASARAKGPSRTGVRLIAKTLPWLQFGHTDVNSTECGVDLPERRVGETMRGDCRVGGDGVLARTQGHSLVRRS